MSELRDNIYKALSLFIEAIPPYIVSFLSERADGESWENLNIETLYDNQRRQRHTARVQDVYEIFLRYDDKPLITGPDAVKNHLLRYCRNGQFA